MSPIIESLASAFNVFQDCLRNSVRYLWSGYFPTLRSAEKRPTLRCDIGGSDRMFAHSESGPSLTRPALRGLVISYYRLSGRACQAALTAQAQPWFASIYGKVAYPPWATRRA